MNDPKDMKQILDYYNAGKEKERLQQGIGVIEWERSKEIITRYLGGLPGDQKVIYDIGGGTGVSPLYLTGILSSPGGAKERNCDSGLTHLKTVAVEGPVWIVPTFAEKWENKRSREALLKISSLVEEQESLPGMSPHILAIARK